MSLTMALPTHLPVLLAEAVEALAVRRGGQYIDCTLGLGGHAAAVLDRVADGGRLLGIDADAEAVRLSAERLGKYGESVVLVNDNFVRLEAVARENGFVPADGVLFDLGLSSMQLDTAERGFSFRQDAPLDMRYGPGQSVTAADIVNTFSENELARLLHEYGEERYSHRIARNIVRSRPVNTTGQLAGIVERAVGGRREKIHPATRTFLAIRIAVNDELRNLASSLEQAVRILGEGGRLVVISYHSLEDRIVKRFLKREATGCACPPGTPVCQCGRLPTLKLLTRKIVVPSRLEVEINPRSRSAKLRAAERLSSGG